MSPRMETALQLADKCWRKAYRASPEFVEQYLTHAEQLLVERPVVMGDEFRAYCQDRGLALPSTLHHNTWVSGPRSLWLIGWIAPISKVEPSQKHNHMPEVTVWKSMIFGNEGRVAAVLQPSLFD